MAGARVLKALDLFCGEGGAGMGLHRAGFEVVGVDIVRRKRYPFAFVQADALSPPFDLATFDLIWASPPCQAYSVSRTRAPGKREHPDLVAPTRQMLENSGRPWILENVQGAPLRSGIMLCGAAFGMGAGGRQLRRHRYFETSHMIMSPPCGCDNREKIGVYGNGGGWANRFDPDRRGYKGNVAESREAMGMPWASIAGLSQAIPPCYAEYVARALMGLENG